MPPAAAIFEWVLIGIVLAALVPVVVAGIQILFVLLHSRRYLESSGAWLPNVAVLIPAWNEALVLRATVERLSQLDYPSGQLRVYVIDDASTDDTPAVMAQLCEEFPEQVRHLRRAVGGQGKAHTLNHGLDVVLAEGWAEAVLITDADVLFTPTSLRKMARHFADPNVGAVTAYVKEGSVPGTFMTRTIAFEYVTAQAVARRSLNVLGTQACLAGGAQLHRTENLREMGGRISTDTLAEDTVTTLDTELAGRKVLLEPNAIVWAEEPPLVRSLWGQRIRWGRGNLQVTRRYREYWFRPGKNPRLGSWTFGAIWFSVLLQPFLLIFSSIALVTLYVIGNPNTFALFKTLWLTSAVVYLMVIGAAAAVDSQTLRRAWWEALLFPGLINVIFVWIAILTPSLAWTLQAIGNGLGFSPNGTQAFVVTFTLFSYAWLSLSMAVSYAGKCVEKVPRLGPPAARVLLFVGGYGPLLCAVTIAAAMLELRNAQATWVKTEKVGAVRLGGG